MIYDEFQKKLAFDVNRIAVDLGTIADNVDAAYGDREMGEEQRIREHNIQRRSDVLVRLVCAYISRSGTDSSLMALEYAREKMNAFTPAELGLLPEPGDADKGEDISEIELLRLELDERIEECIRLRPLEAAAQQAAQQASQSPAGS